MICIYILTRNLAFTECLQEVGLAELYGQVLGGSVETVKHTLCCLLLVSTR